MPDARPARDPGAGAALGEREDRCRALAAALAKRVQESRCLRAVSAAIDEASEPGESCRAVAGLVLAGLRYPESACARVTVAGQQHATPGFRETPWGLSAEIRMGQRAVGAVEVCYLEPKPAADVGPFFTEESELLTAIAARIGARFQRYEAEEALRRGETRFRALLENSTDVVTVIAPDGRMTYTSPSIQRVLGYAHEELVGGDAFGRVHPEDLPSVQRVFAAAVADPSRPASATFRYRHKDGSWRYFETVATNLIHDPVVAGLVLNSRDVTERVRAEEASAESERHYRDIFDGSNDTIMIAGMDGRILEVNEVGCERLGRSGEELRRMTLMELDSPEFAATAPDRIAALRSTGRAIFESAQLHADGHAIPVELSARIVEYGGAPAVLGIARDITERKAAEAALAFKNILLSTQQETSLDGILVVDDAGAILSLNRRFVELWGLADEVIASRSDERAMASVLDQLADPDGFVARVAELYAHREERTHDEIALRDGRTFERYSAPMLGADGRYFGRVWYFRDITDRKQAEEALRRSEAEHRGLIENATIGIYRSSPEGRFLMVNPALVAMLGYDSTEDVLRLDIPRDVYVDPKLRGALINSYTRGAATVREVEWKRRDGSHISVRVTAHHIPGPDGEIACYEVLAEDVTQQRHLEEQFRQAQRLEAVGRLAGGVAHDFNNILTAIIGYSELLLEDFTAGDTRRGRVAEIRSAANRAAALTRQLLAFSRKQVLQARVLDLNAVVGGLDEMLRRLVGEGVKLEMVLDASLGRVKADPGQVEQILLNLAVNARDAMPDGGRLTIETANAVFDDAYAQAHVGSTPGRYVMLAVSDTGSGMDAATQARIFDPFFTTKEQGKGTGLGLATVYGIAKQSGGNVYVYSEPGRGATFKVYLPRVGEPVEAGRRTPAGQPAAEGRETVLLAEDDPSVRGIISATLAQHGYRVLAAPDGETALETARAEPGEIQLLLTDLVMPGIGGRELAEAVGAERADLRVLYMSGYTDDVVVRHGVLEAGVPYLQKPFTPAALASMVRAVLDDVRPAAAR
jgi:two-component system, cell cycle sensor histidine kinase and response regulator CckA